MSEIAKPRTVTFVDCSLQYAMLDEAGLASFGQALRQAAMTAQPPFVTVDLAGTRMIGSRFLEILIDASRMLKDRGGDFGVCNVNEDCREVLRVAKLDTLWKVFASRQEATFE